jgi:U3 small nucleolar RNA-associated protein 25
LVIKHNQKFKQKEKEAKLKSLDLETILENNPETKETNGKKFRKKERKSRANMMEALVEENNKNKNNPEYVERIDLITKELDQEEEHLKDQGFVRPRLLILTPLRSSAKAIVEMMIQVLGENTSVSGLEKFQNEYSDPENDELLAEQNLNPGRDRKPDDWKAHFHGNIDDDFKIGIQVNPGHGKGSGKAKGVYFRLFSDFYLSDIIVASPIGLKLILENSNTSYKANKNNFDILTSIEQVIIHQGDVLLMQNFEHLNDIFQNYLNVFPKENHDITDYSRIRPYFLNGLSRFYRQLMVTSSFNTPDFQSFFRENATSRSGYYRIKKNWDLGIISHVIVPNVKQIFQLIPGSNSSASLDDAEELKFNYFKENILTKMNSLKQSRVLLFIPSYFDFIKIRNYMMKEEMNAVYISEYSRESEISRGRSRFYQGMKDILVYSGRAHFFR